MFAKFLAPFMRNYAANGIRHLSSAAAGALVTYGVVNADQSAQATAALLFLLSSVWSWLEKKGFIDRLFAAL